MKDEFLATLSHELRTPLNAILGWTQVLKLDKEDPAVLSEAIGVIERNVHQQSQLIEDLSCPAFRNYWWYADEFGKGL